MLLQSDLRPPTAAPLPDIQATRDTRGVAIDRVGVSNVRWPLVLVGPRGQRQHAAATVSMTVSLGEHDKGTHMSRFLQVLDQHREVSPETVPLMAEQLRQRLNADSAQVEMEFPFFVRKEAPVTGEAGWMEFTCGVAATAGQGIDLVTRVRAAVATLCPCSREISEQGAHNQRGYVDLAVRTRHPVWYEELIDTVEESASCALYPVLKRPDEKWVTERAYDNPRFVEDLLREVAVAMREDPRVTWYRVAVENHESIHAHNAFASLERWK